MLLLFKNECSWDHLDRTAIMIILIFNNCVKFMIYAINQNYLCRLMTSAANAEFDILYLRKIYSNLLSNSASVDRSLDFSSLTFWSNFLMVSSTFIIDYFLALKYKLSQQPHLSPSWTYRRLCSIWCFGWT